MPHQRCCFALLCAALYASAAPLIAETPPTEDEHTLNQIANRRRYESRTISVLSFTPDGSKLLAGTLDGKVHIYNADATKLLSTLTTSSMEVYAFAISADGRLLLTAGSCPEVQIWDLAKGEVVRRLRGFAGCVAALAVSPDGKLLATGEYGKAIRLWKTADWTEVRKLTTDLDRVTSLSFSPDGKTLASGGTMTRDWRGFLNGQADFVRLWDVDTGKLKRELPVQGSQVAFAPDGYSILASGMVIRQEPTDGPGRYGLNGYGSVVWYDVHANCTIVDTTKMNFGSSISISTNWHRFASINNMTASMLHLSGNTINSDRANGRAIHLWDPLTRTEATGLPGDPNDPTTIAAFFRTGAHLAIGRFRGGLSVCSLLPNGKNPISPITKTVFKNQDHLWAGLSAREGDFGYAAMWEMLKSPAVSLDLAKARLKSSSPNDLVEMEDWIRDLAERDFETRNKARTKLRQVAWRIIPRLRQARDEATSAQVRKDLNELLADVLTGRPAEEYLAQSRMVHLLEAMNTADSRGLLRQLADGDNKATITQCAMAAIRRLEP